MFRTLLILSALAGGCSPERVAAPLERHAISPEPGNPPVAANLTDGFYTEGPSWLYLKANSGTATIVMNTGDSLHFTLRAARGLITAKHNSDELIGVWQDGVWWVQAYRIDPASEREEFATRSLRRL